ncbi:MAG: helix-turn-helix domain-containing protein [Caldilineaceae bacterium]|nr:helix-turn-helix domain-containing protein [Caldilineaceae bacterium]
MAGDEYLQRTVSWACSLRPSPPAFPKLEGDEIALIDMSDLRRLDSKMGLARVVNSLRNAHVTAIAVLGPVEDAAIQAAKANRVALLQLSNAEPLVQVERAVIRLIVDRAGYIAQRAAELQHQLNQVALDGGGIDPIAAHLHTFIQQPVLILRDNGNVAASAGLENFSERRQQAIIGSLPNIMTLRSWVATRANESNKPVGLLPLNQEDMPPGQNGAASHEHFCGAVVAPIVANDAIRGYCLALRPFHQATKSLTPVEEIAVSQGASAAALEWAKQNAIDVAEERMRAAFLDELLASEIVDEQAWIQRGASLGFELTRPHVAWMVQVSNVPDWSQLFARFVREQGVNAPTSRRPEGVLLFWPIDNPSSGRELKVVANDFVNRVHHNSPKADIIIGIGRPGVGPAAWMQSQDQARESWRLGRTWRAASVTYFGDLGLYQLLTALGNNAEAARFYRKTLGRLTAHDAEHNSELVVTLEAFFECHGNLSQTAAQLHIHRNTLTYRLERIAEIAQLDLNDADARFSLQLALKLQPIMK